VPPPPLPIAADPPRTIDMGIDEADGECVSSRLLYGSNLSSDTDTK
jgi:hypothetical protein